MLYKVQGWLILNIFNPLKLFNNFINGLTTLIKMLSLIGQVVF